MQELAHQVRAAADRLEVRAAVADLYGRVHRAVEARQPVCVLSGRCCHFDKYGHRLYVTTIELAAFLYELELARARGLVGATEKWDGTGCPFQASKLCGVHAFRPFGCRMFFCDETSTEWQNQAYERFHGELKQLHETLGVPYAYVEWRQALRAIGLAMKNETHGSEASPPDAQRMPLPILNPEP